MGVVPMGAEPFLVRTSIDLSLISPSLPNIVAESWDTFPNIPYLFPKTPCICAANARSF